MAYERKKKTTFFHAVLSWKTWNFLFWGNHVLSCPKKKKYFKETGKRLTGLISCSGCLYDLMTPGSWNYTPFTTATTLYMIVLQHPPFHYGEWVYGKTRSYTYTRKQYSFRGGSNFSRNPNLNKPDVNCMFTRRHHRADIMSMSFPQTKQSTHALSSQMDSFVT